MLVPAHVQGDFMREKEIQHITRVKQNISLPSSIWKGNEMMMGGNYLYFLVTISFKFFLKPLKLITSHPSIAQIRYSRVQPYYNAIIELIDSVERPYVFLE
ncbi:100aa long hypothetical protein [Pyrococcus horikoshii OT3]|uniref:Uncharacterized protein n=1 Tax=Pyrococcus horikoshii (strain ATCC 700860 / DSM 12428 / JCM 9974 / NBRC 100139 / OT-3) TaxID=70601 RepID=O57845_PYRHO|nr:100aa long hypothetical protein [Pyrococcus horikoshii OT3]